MDVMVVGIDVSKDRLDVAVRPTGESLIFKRTGVGIEDLIARLGALSPKLVAIEATGEAVVAAGLAGAGRNSVEHTAPGLIFLSPPRSPLI
jgi:transposase